MMRGFKSIFLLSIGFFLNINSVFAQQKIEQWNRFELKLPNISVKNSFSDNILSATFTHKDTSITVSGFYDGNNQYIVRFMPEKTGIWKYSPRSTFAFLNNCRSRRSKRLSDC